MPSPAKPAFLAPVSRFARVLLLTLPALVPAISQESQNQVLLGAGLMHLRCPPRSVYGSVEVDRISGNGWMGAWASIDGYSNDAFIGAGAVARLELGPGAALYLGTGPGTCTDSAASRLGFRFQFRSSLGLDWRMAHRGVITVSVSHYSDGGMSRRNPGVEGVRILYGRTF